MITLTRDQWFGLSEQLLDDSAGAVDVPWEYLWNEQTDTIDLTFSDAREETMFLLKYKGNL